MLCLRVICELAGVNVVDNGFRVVSCTQFAIAIASLHNARVHRKRKPQFDKCELTAVLQDPKARLNSAPKKMFQGVAAQL